MKPHINLEGRNVVIEALVRGRNILEILIDKGARGDKIEEIQNIAKRNGVRVSVVEREVLDGKSRTEAHQGVIAFAEPLRTYSVSEVLKSVEKPVLLLIKEVLYEQNLGAVIRTAAACGVDAVVVPKGKRPALTPVVERVSMGASNVVKVCEESILSALSIVKRAGVKAVGVEVGGGKLFFEEDLTGPIAFVFGSEDSALSLPQVKKCDIVVRAPMQNGIQSLNLSVAVGVILFEKVSQEHEKLKTGYGGKTQGQI